MSLAMGRATADPFAPAPQTAREALAAEWRAANPQTPGEIRAFYEQSLRMADDLHAWHASATRRQVTAMLVHVATTMQAACVVDIGCGAGHDLLVLQEALPAAALYGIEPNNALRQTLRGVSIACVDTPFLAPIETADLLICIDVLEHVPNPERFLSAIAQRAPVGCILFEATATFDIGTPLHLPANRGWHPGHALEAAGWVLVDRTDMVGQAERIRVWRRVATQAEPRASALLCAYRTISADSMQSILGLTGGHPDWRVRIKAGDALIARSRSIIVTRWLKETADDVFLMIDDDIAFDPNDADRLVALCRDGRDIICGAYPVHNGAHLACKIAMQDIDLTFGAGLEPVEAIYAATGFMAVHRRVIDALVADLPLCHAVESWAFYPLFQTMVIENERAGGYEWLSEDYGFSHLARAAGFRVWLDRQTKLTHHGNVGISLANMQQMHDAIMAV